MSTPHPAIPNPALMADGQTVIWSAAQGRFIPGSAGGTFRNLTNVFFADNGGVAPAAPTGNIEAPFATAAAGLAALVNAENVLILAPGDYSGEGQLSTPGTDNYVIRGWGGNNTVVSTFLDLLNITGDTILDGIDVFSNVGHDVTVNDTSFELRNSHCSNQIVGAGTNATVRLLNAQVGAVDLSGASGSTTIEVRNSRCGSLTADDIIIDAWSYATAVLFGATFTGAVQIRSTLAPANGLSSLAAVQSITGATTQDQVDSIVAALVALGLATDNR